MPERQRILIMGASFGGGQGAAARALHEYYESHYAGKVEVRLLDFFEEFAPSVNVLAKFAYQQTGEFFPSLSGTFREVARSMPGNAVVEGLETAGIARASAYIEDFAPDAVISTFSVAGGIVAEIKTAHPLVAATVITDYSAHESWLHPGMDLYFVASKEAREELVVRGVAWERVIVSGVPIRECFSSSVEQAAARTSLGLTDRFTVMLAPAVSTQGDLGDLARRFASVGVQVVVVAGHNKRLQRRIKEVAQGTRLLKGYGFVDEMHTMMRAVDVVVANAGGLMVSEAFAMGVPVIVHGPVPDQESHNVDFIVNSGAGLSSRDEEDVVEKVRFLSTHPDRRAQLAANATLLGRPVAAQTVCERTLAALR